MSGLVERSCERLRSLVGWLSRRASSWSKASKVGISGEWWSFLLRCWTRLYASCSSSSCSSEEPLSSSSLLASCSGERLLLIISGVLVSLVDVE